MRQRDKLELAKRHGRMTGANRRRSQSEAVPDPVMNPALSVDYRQFGQRDIFEYKMGDCLIILARMPVSERWHMSISTAHRYPTWDEIAHARYSLIPDDVVMAMVLPSREDYINVHNYCFQLHEIDETPDVTEHALLEVGRSERD